MSYIINVVIVALIAICILGNCSNDKSTCKVRVESITTDYKDGLISVSNIYYDEQNIEIGSIDYTIEKGDTTDVVRFENNYWNGKLTSRLVTDLKKNDTLIYYTKSSEAGAVTTLTGKMDNINFSEKIQYKNGLKISSKDYFRGNLNSELFFTYKDNNLIQIESTYYLFNMAYGTKDSIIKSTMKFEYMDLDNDGNWTNRYHIMHSNGALVDTFPEVKVVSFIERPCDQKMP